MAHVVLHLRGKHKALSSTPSTTKKRKSLDLLQTEHIWEEHLIGDAVQFISHYPHLSDC
jgi:hypothetical protein